MEILPRKITRLIPVVGLIAAATACLCLLAHPAPGVAKPKPRVAVAIVNAGQAAMVNRGILRVKVRSPRRGRVRVRGFSATFDGRWALRPLTRVAWPRFRRPGQVRVFDLRLTAFGRRQAATCQDRALRVQAGRFQSRPRAMVRQTWNCRPRPVDLSRAAYCDFIAAPDGPVCMSPFPNDFYTLADSHTETGRRINFQPEAMPVNADGAPIDPAPFNRSDGFSQGQSITVRVPGLDNQAALEATNPVGLTDPSEYLRPNAPVVVLDARTRERHPIWVEIDSNASRPGATSLIIRPLVNFDPATRYLVVLRHLKDASGNLLGAPEGFRYYRDFLPSRRSRINGRRSHFEDIFRRLRAAGIRRSTLYLTWDFTTASDQNNTERARSMRNQAFAWLGDGNLADRRVQGLAPPFTVDAVAVNPGGPVARRIKGTFLVPCFLEHPGSAEDCASGARMRLSASGVPRAAGVHEADFECILPRAITDPGSVGPEETVTVPGRAMVYGHGLLGSIGNEVEAEAQRRLSARGFVICGTDQIGMAAEDAGTLVGALRDLSNLPRVADRLQQGLINQLFLGRLMIHRRGLVSRAAFRVDPGLPDPSLVPGGDGNATVPAGSPLEPVIESGPTARGWYRGNGMGGILGGALMALAPDFDKGSLGVAAMNYSVLLPRSSAWSALSPIFNSAYRRELGRPVALSLAQMLWDRAESNGYAHRMTDDPLPGTPPHEVLIDAAFGDHLVSNWQTNVEARTIGARAVRPLVVGGRWPGVDGDWGIESIAGYPYGGSAVAYWDSGPLRAGPGPGGLIGTLPPPLTNTAPPVGVDPHADPRVAETAIEMIDAFLRPGGAVTDPCAPQACFAGGWTG